MEYLLGGIFIILFAGAYAAILPYKRDFEGTVAKLEKQNKIRMRMY